MLFRSEMIFKFKLPPKPVPKIDLQEWNDMRKLMEKLQKQSQAMKSTQQEISSLKKQLSETTGFFKGKARKSLEGKIEQSEKQEKRIHTDMEQTVKQAGYPDVQSFAKTYQKSEKLVREYNEELRAWKNQTERLLIKSSISTARKSGMTMVLLLFGVFGSVITSLPSSL